MGLASPPPRVGRGLETTVDIMGYYQTLQKSLARMGGYERGCRTGPIFASRGVEKAREYVGLEGLRAKEATAAGLELCSLLGPLARGGRGAAPIT